MSDDAKVIVEFKDGSVVELPSINEMNMIHLKMLAQADAYLEMLNNGMDFDALMLKALQEDGYV